MTELYAPGLRITEDPHIAPALLPSLRTLRVRDRVSLDFPRRISCPNLTNLTLHRYNHIARSRGPPPPLQPLEPLLLVRTLTLINFGLDRHYVMPYEESNVDQLGGLHGRAYILARSAFSLLSVFPNVEEISFEECGCLDVVFLSISEAISRGGTAKTKDDVRSDYFKKGIIIDTSGPPSHHNDFSCLKVIKTTYPLRRNDLSAFAVLRRLMGELPGLTVKVKLMNGCDEAFGKVLEEMRMDYGLQRFSVYGAHYD